MGGSPSIPAPQPVAPAPPPPADKSGKTNDIAQARRRQVQASLFQTGAGTILGG